jgi:2-keto-3-deoxy-6-phosphogluconate aldolase
MNKYAKFVAIVLATVLSALSAALLGDSVISPNEWVNVAILGVGALGVFAAPNVPGAAYTKSILAVLTAGLTVLASVIIGGVGTAEIIQIVLAGLGAVGVYAVPNRQ